MRVTVFPKNPNTYSCNSYLVRGNNNSLTDINTLIDVGTDNFVYNELQSMSTGVGKRRVEQIILTHEHFDHLGGLPLLINEYKPSIIGLSTSLPLTEKAYDGMYVKMGDSEAVIYHTPGHSSDSICIYVPSEKILFSGDTPIIIRKGGGTFTKDYVEALHRISRLDIVAIYSGHDIPIMKGCNDLIKQSLQNVLKGEIFE